MNIEIQEPSLVLLVGTAGSGKTTFAARHFAPTEVLSSDRFRAMIGDDAGDQRVTADAFELVHVLVEKRLKHRRLAVVDATNVERAARAALIRLARAQHMLVDAVVLDVPVEVCVARDEERSERSVGPAVIGEHRGLLDKSLREMSEEGFRVIHHLEGVEAIEAASIARARLRNDLRDQHGPFDVIGDVHGCATELRTLLAKLGYGADGAHPAGRRVVFLGDLVDRGPEVVGALRIAMQMVKEHDALCVMGNHEAKLLRWLGGKNPKPSHGLAASIEQLEREPAETREAVREFIEGLVDHYVLDGGALVVAHAGLSERLHGRTSGKVKAFCLYGDTTGALDENGLPIRLDWAQHYRGEAVVVYGHTPTIEPTWVNQTICIDSGCVFGGALSALRWPERELVQVPAQDAYYYRRS